jgi:hypothetical protein
VAKKKSARFKNRPAGIAAMIGRALGRLAAKRDRLARQLAGVDKEIAAVKASVDRAAKVPRTTARRAPSAVSGKRVLSDATRRKMADAAKARWAAARQAGKKRLG